jgi:hypothetical protein
MEVTTEGMRLQCVYARIKLELPRPKHSPTSYNIVGDSSNVNDTN